MGTDLGMVDDDPQAGGPALTLEQIRERYPEAWARAEKAARRVGDALITPERAHYVMTNTVGKNKARQIAHEARQAEEHAGALARRAERQRAHQERCALDQAAKSARERAQAREHSVVCFAQWAGVLP